MRSAQALLFALLGAACSHNNASQSAPAAPGEPGGQPTSALAEPPTAEPERAPAAASPKGHLPPLSPATTPRSPASSSAAPAAEPAPAPDTPFIELDVPHHRPAVVALPLGATTRRPVLVAAHGAGDRPEWQCHVWRGIVGDRAFVLCPRGFPTNPYVPPEHTGYFYTTHHALGREITLAFEALVKRFPEHVDPVDPLFAGFSQGAIMGALVLPRHPVKFARAALVEGGYGFFQEWNIPVAQAWKDRGGLRALLACGRVRCVEQADLTAYYMKRAGLTARVLHAEGAGHSYGGRMEIALREAFAWLIEGDPRFEGRPPRSAP